MEIGKENEGEIEKLASNSLVSSVVLREDSVNLLDFIERLNNGHVRTSLDLCQIKELTLKLTFVSAFCHLYYSFFLESCNDEMSCISNKIHDLVQSLFHPSGEDMLVNIKNHDLLENIKSYIDSHCYVEPSHVTMTEDRLVELLDTILVYLKCLLKCCSESIFFPSMTPCELLQNLFGNLRDFHRLKVNGCVEYETIEYVLPHLQLMALRVVNFCFTLLNCQLDKFDELNVSLVNSKLANLLVEVIPVELEVMHICCTNLKASKSEEVERFIKQLVEASPDILRVSLIHLQEHMVNAGTPSVSTCNIHVMIEFLLIILPDVPKDVIRHDKLFVLLTRVRELTKEVFVLVRNLEENMNETSDANLNLLESIELFKEDLKNDFLKARADSSRLCFPMSDGPLFMTLLLTNLKDLVNSNASSVALIKEEIKQVKEDLEIIRSFFGYGEQELHRDLWTHVLDLAYEAEHAINSILARDHGLLQLIFILPDTIEKIKLVKKEVQEKIPKSSGIIVANAPNKPVERNSSSTVGKIIVGLEVETECIILMLTSGPAEIDVISIVGMPGIGKTTLAYRVYNDKFIVDHFDVCAWCTVDQERNEKKLLQKIFNQVVGLKERFNEDHDIDDDVADKLRKQLFGKRYLIVLDGLWDTATFDELMRPFPEFQNRSRVILTSRKVEVAWHGKCHSEPHDVGFLCPKESWELLEKRVFGEERCPDELKDVGEKIARKCDGIPLVLDLIGGVISRKEMKEALWLEVLNNLSSFIFKDEEEVVKVIQLSYDHLSDHVKPCLVCLASYPKDKNFRISELKDLWISQGLVEQIEMKSAEEVVDELISSSLVIPFDNSICKIHDLVHDFCYIKSRKEKLFHFLGGSNASSSSGMMERGITIRYDQRLFDLDEGQTKGEDNKSLVSSVVLRRDIVNIQDFIERVNSGRVQTSFDMYGIEELTLKLTFVSTFCRLYYSLFLESCKDEMSCISNEIHDLVQSLFHPSGVDMLVSKRSYHLLKYIRSYISSHIYAEPSRVTTMTEDRFVELLDAIHMYLQSLLKCCSESIFPSMTQYELLQNVFGNLRDFHRLKVNGCVEYEIIEYVLPHLQLMALRVVNFCFTFLDCQVYKFDESDVSRVNSKLANLLVEVIPVELEVMHICCTNLKGSKSEEVGRFINQLLEASPDILRVSLINLQEHMVNALTPSASTCNIHVMIEFLLIILTDVLKDVIRHDKLFVLLARVRELTKEVFVLVLNIEENLNEASDANLNLMENIELLKKDLKNDFLKARADSSQLCFPMSDGPLFMTLLLTNLKDLANSNASSVAFIKKEIKQLKEDLEIIRLFFGYVEQELHRDLWTHVLDVAYEAEHAIHSILARDHSLLQLIFILPDTVEKIKLVKKEVQEKIPKSSGIIVANTPNKLVERNSSSTVGKIIVGFEEETKLIIRKLTSGPAEIDVISIVGMPGIGKSTLAFRVYNDESIVDHFDICAWCTVDQERNEKKLLQKIFNQVTGLEERFSDDIADKLWKRLCGQRYLIVLDDMWDTATFDELMRPFPEFQKGSRVILTSRQKEVALHGKCQSDPLYLRLLTPEVSWELLEKRVFGEERCPDELKDVGKMIARKCDGLPLVLDLIGGVISRKEMKEALWLEVLNNLSSFIFNDEEEVVKVIQLSYDHLSDHVKPCLVCLASYPRDENLRISELKDLWISQGLVEQIEMKSAEEVVNELISSSLVIPFNDSICKIHDLVHDFCYIKSRKEKLFHFLGGSKAPSSSSSSSDLMPRGIIIQFNTYIFRLNENFVVFDPEKKNPCVEHLLTLKVYADCLPHKSHLKHLRLLKSLDLKGIALTDSLLNEIGMLIHLKYLIIQTTANTLPPSFSNLCNLEILKVNNPSRSCMVLSPWFWSLAKLRDVRMKFGVVFDPYINEPTVLDEDLRLENLRTLRKLYLPGLEDTEDIIFKRFPNLQKLKVYIGQLPDCSAEKICFPRLDVLNELEELHLSASWDSFGEYTHGFPLSLKTLKLRELALTSDTLSRIARLPNLQKLILVDTIIEEGKEWNMEDVTFQNLKYLHLNGVRFSEWQVDAEKSFPVLEKLLISRCFKLMDIPDSFGDIASLQLLGVWFSPQLYNSSFNIKKYIEEMNGEDKLDVNFFG